MIKLMYSDVNKNVVIPFMRNKLLWMSYGKVRLWGVHH